jgi:hypothetical protein
MYGKGDSESNGISFNSTDETTKFEVPEPRFAETLIFYEYDAFVGS